MTRIAATPHTSTEAVISAQAGAGRDPISIYAPSTYSSHTLDPGFRRDDDMECKVTAQ